MNKSTRYCLKTALLPLMAALAAAPGASAAVVLTNLTETLEDADPISSSSWGANRFVTDNSAAGFLLEGVTLRIATPSPPSATLSGGSLFPTVGAGGFAVSIYSNSSNLPGTVLATLSGDSDPVAPGDYTYTASGLTLQPGTSYWIVAGVISGPGEYGWAWTESNSFTGSWILPLTETYTLSEDGGLTWDTPAWDAEPFLLSISASPVPEPGQYAAVFAMGALALVLRRQVVRGAAERSFGIHVARLAGLPREVLARAQEILGRLEAEGAALQAQLRASPGQPAGRNRVTQGAASVRAAEDLARPQMELF